MTSLTRRLALALAGPALLAAAAWGQPAAAQSPAVPPDAGARTAIEGSLPKPARAGGYLPAAHVPDAVPLIGPPPSPESGTETGDVATFRATRALQGGPRWALATRDDVFGADALMQDFSCALGAPLTAADAPALHTLLSRVVVDAGVVATGAKKAFRRPRPFVDHDGPICVAKDGELARSWSYPSGHSTYSWTVGLILAEAAPDRAAEILGRARSYGESRVVCGVHYESDIQAGRVAASAVFSALQAEPAFQRDLAAVRVELAALRGAGGVSPSAPQCRIEADSVAHPVW